MASASAGVKIGDWILIILAVIAAYFAWVWLNSQSSGTMNVTPTSFVPSGTYTYGPTGLVNWSALPQGLAPTQLNGPWYLPTQTPGGSNGSESTGVGQLPVYGLGGSGSSGSFPVVGAPVLPSGARA